jgi:hypothetical protein
MSIAIYKNKCNPAASAKNVEYITRDSACESLSFHNLDELRHEDHTQAKSNAINYAEEREIEEESRTNTGSGIPRNHNRMILSFDRKEDTEVAREEAHKYLDKNFSNQKAIVSIHQDQDKTHVHIWFDCRDVETDKKTQIKPQDFYTLDEKWAKQYDRKYGTEYEKEYTTKKRETFEWKKEQYELKQGAAGKKELPENKPERHVHNKTEIIKDKELKSYGITKSTDREDKQLYTTGERSVEKSQQTLDFSQQRADVSELKLRSGEQELNRANTTADGAVREINELSGTVKNIPERELPDRDLIPERTRDRDDGYSR